MNREKQTGSQLTFLQALAALSKGQKVVCVRTAKNGQLRRYDMREVLDAKFNGYTFFEAVEPAEKKQPQRIDSGKIRALHRAGWDIAKIAREMSLPEVTILAQLEGS